MYTHRCTHEYTHHEQIHTRRNNHKGFPTCCCLCRACTFPQDLENSRHRGFPQDLGIPPRPEEFPKTWGRPRSSRISKSRGSPSSAEFHMSTECGQGSKFCEPGYHLVHIHIYIYVYTHTCMRTYRIFHIYIYTDINQHTYTCTHVYVSI